MLEASIAGSASSLAKMRKEEEEALSRALDVNAFAGWLDPPEVDRDGLHVVAAAPVSAK